MGSHGIITAAEVGTLEPDRVVDMVTAADHPDAEAVLVPDTAMHTLAVIDRLEAAVGKPVLTANQVTVWKGLQLVGAAPAIPGLRSEEHTSELQSLMRISYAVFCLKKKKKHK